MSDKKQIVVFTILRVSGRRTTHIPVSEALAVFENQCNHFTDGLAHGYNGRYVTVTKKGKRRAFHIDGARASREKVIELIKGIA